MLRGIPISPGFTVARAFRVDEALATSAPGQLDPAAAAAEVVRFDKACQAVAGELDAVIARVTQEVGEEPATIFRAHRLLLRDPALVAKVKRHITADRVDAATALFRTRDEFADLFARVNDEYLRERLADIRDVVGRLIDHLTFAENATKLENHDPVVLVAAEIRPSQVVAFDKLPVVGIVTESGGTTGHAAILARSLGIPAVSGLSDLLEQVHTGDMMVVDGREGVVVINPGPEVEAAYRKLQREYVDLRDRLVENRELEAVTLDGTRVELFANVNTVIDAAAAVGVGACGVGLFRTEYVFLAHPSVPTEEEQLTAYRGVVEAAPAGGTVIRTLDLGGDKQVGYLGHHREANPFMGWRSIRMSADHPEFFQTQLRAVLRAAVHGKVSLMFPMISTVEEVLRLRRLVERAKMSLAADGLEFADKVPLGVMIEVPAAAVCVDHILDEVDFVSVGSNDLIQYMMAADRDNPKVAHLCDPCHPAVFRVLHRLLKTCRKRGKPVTLCGEMAGRPTCVLPLLGMGMTRASMSPAFVPIIKEVVRSVTLAGARKIARRVRRMRTASEVKAYLVRKVRKLCPSAAEMDIV